MKVKFYYVRFVVIFEAIAFHSFTVPIISISLFKGDFNRSLKIFLLGEFLTMIRRKCSMLDQHPPGITKPRNTRTPKHRNSYSFQLFFLEHQNILS